MTSYDASYLAVAISSDARLLTQHDVTWPRYKEASAYLAKLRAEALAARTG